MTPEQQTIQALMKANEAQAELINYLKSEVERLKNTFKTPELTPQFPISTPQSWPNYQPYIVTPGILPYIITPGTVPSTTTIGGGSLQMGSHNANPQQPDGTSVTITNTHEFRGYPIAESDAGLG